MKIRLGDKLIGEDEPCFIIAEAGVNHNGDIDTAKKMIAAAKEAGADAVKFQTFTAEKLATKEVGKADYQKKNMQNDSGSQFDMLKKLELGREYHTVLQNYCNEKGILFLSTPFDMESIDFLDSINVPAFKISSGDLNNHPFLEHLASKNKPILLSTGMSTMNEIRDAVNLIKEKGNDQIVLLHCVTAYPTPIEEANVRAMLELKKLGVDIVGFSDHTAGIYASVAASALGASVIEKHFTLDRNMDGPDHAASLEPGDLKELVSAIRSVEASLGTGEKIPMPSEKSNITVARKRIVAKRNIASGKPIEMEDLDFKRSTEGLSPDKTRMIIGKKAAKDIAEDEGITPDMVE